MKGGGVGDEACGSVTSVDALRYVEMAYLVP